MRYDLFISHSSADAGTAQALVTDFENRNITCWMAPRDIPMGSSYHEEIVQAIENSRAVLLLFSGAANKSEHVLRDACRLVGVRPDRRSVDVHARGEQILKRPIN
jgi:hypothetical protein